MKPYKGVGWSSTCYLFYLRTCSKHPFSQKFRRFISTRFFSKGLKLESPHGAIFRLSTFDYIDQQIIFKGSYESKSIEKSIDLMKNGGVFIDIGTNFGLYSINLAKNPKTQVFSFEPNPQIFNKLREHVEINRFQNCTLFNLAIGSEHALIGMTCPAINNSGNYQISEDNIEFYSYAIPLKEVLKQCKITEIELIKIDVEGFEMHVLEGIDWNSYKPKHILLEYIPEQIDSQGRNALSCILFLQEKGYAVFDVLDREFVDFNQSPVEHNLIFKRLD